ncbi:phosphotransferase enzyme family protein [Microthyrium microscopicum]|uniref:Phosphotransferase enzyme family protein n=1 Tax=Microthyrium microscopicum TaxID=703497 RepID=A0A6A6UM24_9PEZI|nr:phosphotransferase enzyme family protein [Microthyrium microscopicum]
MLLLSALYRARSCRLRFYDVHFLVTSSLIREYSHFSGAMISPYDDDNHEFFRYTSGRWLWNEKEQLLERYRRFNVLELQLAAANAVGSHCAKMTKIGEGNFNKVFKLTMEDQSTVIARIPHPNAGPPRITTASEVATMDFARSVLGIPVPRVLAYCANTTNPVGSEYILMEIASGAQLSEVWDHMEIDDQAKVVESVTDVETKFLSISFAQSGALFYAKDMPNCTPAEINGEVSQVVKDDIRRRFVLGPTVEREFWEEERAQMDLDRGPWTSANAYMEAIAHREIRWIQQYAKPRTPSVPLQSSAAQDSPVAHTDLLQKYLSVIAKLIPTEKDLLLPTLWHRDLHRGNVFVKDGEVSSIIDWQSVWVGPRILRARNPQLVDYDGTIQTKLLEGFKDLGPEEKNQVRDDVRRSILLYIYETTTASRNPALYKVMRCPNGKTLDQLLEFASDSWDGDILPLREVLIRIERDWHLTDTTSQCPYHFSKEEIAQHRRDGEGFNETAEFWENLEGRVDRTGYTLPQHFEDAVAYFSKLREVGLETLEDEERKTFDLQTRWLLDYATDDGSPSEKCSNAP